MYLSRLDIHGFKSFATATELRFDSGITAIVGPNGSGKSNIVDAVRWVIGEQRVRILRSDKMNNIIFNGSTERRPLGMAEVQLTIQNSRQLLPVEFSEITLGRRLYRSGEAEYLLNDIPCRLRDIQNLFVDTGMGAGAYSVIELKMIEEILSDKTQDRRRLFEEAAGITKYKQRRSQALRKLEGTQTDLARVYDLTEEISRRVNSLKRQAATAARFKRYQERVRALEHTLLLLEHDRLISEDAVLAADMVRSEDELIELTTRGAVDEVTLEALKSALITEESVAGTNRQILNQHLKKVADLESALSLKRKKMRTTVRDLERIEREQAEENARKGDLLKQAQTLHAMLEAAEDRAGQLTTNLLVAEKARKDASVDLAARQDAIQQLRGKEQDYRDRYSQCRRKLDECKSRVTWLQEEQTRLEGEIKTAEETSSDLARQLSDARANCANLEVVLTSAQEELEAAQAAYDQFTTRINEILHDLMKFGRESAAKTAEVVLMDSLIRSYEEFPDAVRYLSDTDGSRKFVRSVML